jgi:hypothetical protein
MLNNKKLQWSYSSLPRRLQIRATPKGMARFAKLSQLGRWQEQSDSSIANALRVHAGGALPVVPQRADPLDQGLVVSVDLALLDLSL